MDRDKLNKAAKHEAYDNYNRSYNDRRDGFINGAKWLMQQPLSERLTEEEKEKIRKIYQDYYQKWDRALSNRDADCYFYCFSLLEDIFGKDIFEEEGK